MSTSGFTYHIPPPQRWCGQTQAHNAHIWVQSNSTYAACAGHAPVATEDEEP